MKRAAKVQSTASSEWTTEQDIYLIEHSTTSLAELCVRLPFTDTQILERKKRLGLIRRARQMSQFKL